LSPTTSGSSAVARRGDLAITQRQEVERATAVLEWSPWHPWPELAIDARTGGIQIPNGRPGVCEVRRAADSSGHRLTIGRASDLRFRVRQGLVKSKAKHSSGTRIRAQEDVKRLEVRWAETKRPAAVEEEEHGLYRERFGSLPEYTLVT
jgi:hypothetical protein